MPEALSDGYREFPSGHREARGAAAGSVSDQVPGWPAVAPAESKSVADDAAAVRRAKTPVASDRSSSRRRRQRDRWRRGRPGAARHRPVQPRHAAVPHARCRPLRECADRQRPDRDSAGSGRRRWHRPRLAAAHRRRPGRRHRRFALHGSPATDGRAGPESGSSHRVPRSGTPDRPPHPAAGRSAAGR